MSIQSISDHLKKHESLENKVFKIDYFHRLAIEWNEALMAYTENEKVENYAIDFEWLFEAKSYALMLRDTLLQLLKLESKERDGLLVIDKDAYIDTLKNFVQKAAQETFAHLEEAMHSDKEKEKMYYHQISPRKTLNKQFLGINDQVKRIFRASGRLDTYHFLLKKYSDTYQKYLNVRDDKLDRALLQIDTIKHKMISLEANVEKPQLEKMSQFLEDQYLQLEDYSYLPPFSEIIFDYSDKTNIPVSSEGGQMFFKEIDINYEVSRWASATLANKLIENDKRIADFFEQLFRIIFNTRNRIQSLLLEEQSPVDYSAGKYLEPLQKFRDSQYESVKRNHILLREETLYQLQKYLNISNIFDSEHTLFPTSDLMNTVSSSGTKNLEELKKTLKPVLEGINKTKHYIEKVLPSRYHHIVDYINHQTFDPELKEDLFLFTKSGFLGKSLLVNRNKVEHKINRSYEAWNNGFGGSILLVGQRGSGKSSLIQSIPYILHQTSIINLSHGNTIELNGRQLVCDHDLKDVLRFISKNSLGDRRVVTIDDLETWHDHENELFDNINALFQSILNNKKRLYVVVSTNLWMMNHLKQFYDLDAYFSEIIDINRMKDDQIVEALNIRYGATDHRDSDDMKDIQNNMKLVARNSNGIIGEAMLNWCRYNHYKEDAFRLPPRLFEQIIEQNAGILAHIFRYKKVDEQKLRSSLQKGTNHDLSFKLQMLLDRKIIVREHGRLLIIHPQLAYKVEKILRQTVKI